MKNIIRNIMFILFITIIIVINQFSYCYADNHNIFVNPINTICFYPNSIDLKEKDIELEKAQKTSLKVSIKPEKTFFRKITWESSNTNIATVDENGNVKAINAGIAVITARTENNLTAKCNVKVNNPKPIISNGTQKAEVTNISLNVNSLKVMLEDVKIIQLKATIFPTNINKELKKITWNTSNKKIATVDSEGIVTLKNTGTVYIQAKTINGKTAKCKIEIDKYGNKTDSTTFLKLSKTLHEYVRKNKYYYPTKANVTAGKMVQDYAPTILGYKVAFKYPKFGETSKNRYVDCSSYVSWVISAYTGTPIKKKSAALRKNPMNFIKVSVNSKNKNGSLKAGDVLVKNGHTEIYAGNGMSYSCGSTGQIRAKKTTTMSDWTYAFRVPQKLEFRLKNIEIVNAKDKSVTGDILQIKARFNAKIYSSKTVAKMKTSKVPVMKIKFGNGEIKTIENNNKNVKISSDGKEVIYFYKITEQDKGVIQLVNYSGTVYNVAGVSKKIQSTVLSGKITCANQ